MNYVFFRLLAILLAAQLACDTAPLFAQSVPVQSQKLNAPPLGWNSWDSYGKFPDEKAMLENIQTMAQKLKPFGYTYFVIDAGWNIEKNIYGNISSLSIDEFGRYIPAKTAFPRGIKFIADRAHQADLKFGIHIMRGIPRAAYKADLPILGSSYTARQIADTNSICSWNNDNYGIDMSKPGAQEYYDSYIGQLISWGVDFIKADDITGFPEEVKAVKTAIKKTGKNVVLSLSPGEGADISNVAAYNEGDMLRVTKDVWDNQHGITRAFEAWKKWSEVGKREFWLDMDMIPFGHLCLHNHNPEYLTADNSGEGLKNVKGRERMSTFSRNQKYTFITIRALSASPLFMGGNLPTSDAFSLDLITNPKMLSCNQNGVTGTLVYNQNGIEIWKTPRKDDPTRGWVGIFNRNEKKNQSAALSANDFGAVNKMILLDDIWKKGKWNIGSQSQKIDIQANGVVFCEYIIK